MGTPALRQYIDATMPVASIGNGVQICSVYNFQILFRGFFFSVRRASPNDAGCFGASIGSARYKRERKNMCLAAAFCLFMGTSETLKLEMTTKLKDKQTSIAIVRDLLRTFATFPAPLLSHCRLSFNGSCYQIAKRDNGFEL
jgi:hypothetical protein